MVCTSLKYTNLIHLHYTPLSPGAPGSNVDLTIVRRGQLGVVSVSWETGLPNSSLASGSIAPPTGSVQLEADESSAVISLRVRI